MKAQPILTASAVAACAAVLVASAAATSSAATTTIRSETATGAPYAGNWQVSTVGPVTFAITFLGIKVTGSCDNANLKGTVQSNGAGALTAASIGACKTSNGLSSPASDLGDLPSNTGQVTYAPVSGGRDGTLAINGNLTFKLEGDFLGKLRTCYYGFRTGGADGLAFDIYNRDNPNRPLPNDDAQGKSTNITLVKLTGSDGLCPSNGTGSASAIARGESVAGSGNFDRKLYLTS
ncbi:hypothetical protein J4573_44590 [Actinomadura barringtoniae]|uniref:Uncharacterized protein n=1 Tax=Actinomadura barringtoniae TaxID=1427535 RepID=A0A939PSZ7_9ACTN|nr:hypothetical protein [Actinomadura barringtoniae]MBO2454231.1 hypothetical protein [Actinomadura barringtoniae]